MTARLRSKLPPFTWVSFTISDPVDPQYPLARPFNLLQPFDQSQAGPTLHLPDDEDIIPLWSFFNLAHNNSVAAITFLRMLVEQTNVYIAQYLASLTAAGAGMPDVGTTDGGMTNGGMTNGGMTNGCMTNGSMTNGSMTNGGMTDGSTTDGSTPSAGTPRTGTPDAGTPDASTAPRNSTPKIRPVNEREMRQWLGLSILMGVIRKSDTKDYWTTDPLIATPYFGSIMSWNRYLAIARFLHLSDNSVQLPPDTPAHKVRLKKLGSLVDYLNSAFAAAYVPGEFLPLDEIMVPFKGRTYLKQYMPKKPIKWGIKVWGLADPTNGYLCHCDVYTGKDEEHDDWKLGLGGNVHHFLSPHPPSL